MTFLRASTTKLLDESDFVSFWLSFLNFSFSVVRAWFSFRSFSFSCSNFIRAISASLACRSLSSQLIMKKKTKQNKMVDILCSIKILLR